MNAQIHLLYLPDTDLTGGDSSSTALLGIIT